MSGIYGADVALYVTTEQWLSLARENDVSFAIVRCYESSGHVDSSAPATINNAWAAGLSSVDVYHFPCLGSPAAEQIQASVNALRAAGAQFDRYWIDVETGAGWSRTDFGKNAEFLSQLLAAAESLGLEVGIYTSVGEWSATIRSDEFSKYPLWYAEYESPPSPSFDGFIPFGGWTAPVMKQFVGNQPTPSGVEIDGNWAPGPIAGGQRSEPSRARASEPANASPEPTSGAATDIRQAVTAYAVSIAGTSEASDKAKYVCIIAPGETISKQQGMAKESSCGLTIAGIWRACGYYGRSLNAPYEIGSAFARLENIGYETRAYHPYAPGLLPKPGDMVLLGGEAHVYTVISVAAQPDGTVVIQSVDGGIGSGGTGIAKSNHTWRDGYDADPYVPPRPIQGIIDVTGVLTSDRMPLHGFVQAAPHNSRGFDSEAAISASAASQLVADGYVFCTRYVSPNGKAVAALTSEEAAGILKAGLALMLVQRVDASALAFSASLGTKHGEAAAASAVAIGIPMCVNVWLELDSIPSTTESAGLIAYYNAWYTAVYDAGFLPGLRVGTTEVLNGEALGDLKFSHYWQSSGVSASPSPRGYQLVSSAAVGGAQGREVTAKNDEGDGGAAGPGQAEWLIASP